MFYVWQFQYKPLVGPSFIKWRNLFVHGFKNIYVAPLVSFQFFQFLYTQPIIASFTKKYSNLIFH